jgi:dolichol-phosphate mannosyltransferase
MRKVESQNATRLCFAGGIATEDDHRGGLMATRVDAGRRSVASRPRGARRAPAAIRLTVVVPTRNEAGNVDALEVQLGAALEGVAYEVVVVDDSTDDVTRPALREAAQRNPRWRVIERGPAQQTGLASAVVAGIEAARGFAVCVMDGDLQHPPQIVPRLLAAVEAGADIAVASRYMPGGSRAGLDGLARNFVSRSCTWVAQAVFPEARRTSDPLSGFFCCRRTAVSGIELKPRGFKILLELLVCTPGLQVKDVPFVFASRLAGESKASTRQGVLFLGHLLSLFVYVPNSARPLKFAILSTAALGVFSGLLYSLYHAGENPVVAWLAATAGSTVCTLTLFQLPPFRSIARHGELDGDRLQYAIATVSVITSFAVFAVVLVPGRHHIFLAAAVGQACGLLVMLTVNQPPIWSRLTRALRILPVDIDTIARRLGAQHGFWITESDVASGRLDAVAGLVTREMVEAASRRRQPALFVERGSARPQPRVNLEKSSTLVVPRVDESGEVAAIAVFVRRSRSPFQPRHLDQAMTWIASRPQLSAAAAPTEVAG